MDEINKRHRQLAKTKIILMITTSSIIHYFEAVLPLQEYFNTYFDMIYFNLEKKNNMEKTYDLFQNFPSIGFVCK